MRFFCRNIWWIQKMVVTLHSLSERYCDYLPHRMQSSADAITILAGVRQRTRLIFRNNQRGVAQ